MTIADCARHAVTVLLQAGCPREDSRRDVAVLARHLLAWDVATWITRQHDEAPSAFEADLARLAFRRASGEPVAYVTGVREFYGRDFAVTPAVLIPRPETELLVERALVEVDQRALSGPVKVVDVGTGSGCIAITLASERPELPVTATDISDAALAVARNNAARHGVSSRLLFIHGPLTARSTSVDVVVSNPPYIAATSRDQLMPDVRNFEPATALFGGDDGLQVIRDLVPDAFRALRPGGALMMEVGAGQEDQVIALLILAGFTTITAHADLAGITRVVAGVRPPRSV